MPTPLSPDQADDPSGTASPSAAAPAGVARVGLYVSDVARAAEFYARGLHLEPLPTDNPELFQELRTGSAGLNIHHESNVAALALPTGAAGAPRSYVDWDPGSAPAVDETAGRLVDLGATPAAPPRDGYGHRIAVVLDPDGHPVVLSHPLGEGR